MWAKIRTKWAAHMFASQPAQRANLILLLYAFFNEVHTPVIWCRKHKGKINDWKYTAQECFTTCFNEKRFKEIYYEEKQRYKPNCFYNVVVSMVF